MPWYFFKIFQIVKGYLLAILFTVVAILLTLKLGAINPLEPFFFLYPAGFLSVWFGGAGAGILSVLLGCCAVIYWSFFSIALSPVFISNNVWVIFLFIIFGTVFGILIGREKKSLRKEKRMFRELQLVSNQIAERENELNEAIRSRDDFFSLASHELKTPVTALKLQLQLLVRQLSRQEPGNLQTPFQSALTTMEIQINRLTRLVETLLDITRASQGKMDLQLEKTDLGHVISQLIQIYSPVLEASGCQVSFELQGSPQVTCDPFRMEQVFINLISNAAKYAPSSELRITVFQESRYLRVVFADSGPGMTKKELENIFAPFHRKLDSEKVTSGLGLGLFIVRKIVDAHGGTITCDSQVGKGTTFVLQLPFMPQPI